MNHETMLAFLMGQRRGGGSSGGGVESVKILLRQDTTVSATVVQYTVGYDYGHGQDDSPTGYTECAGFIPNTPIAGYISYQDKGRCWALLAKNCSSIDYTLPAGEYEFVITHVTTA